MAELKGAVYSRHIGYRAPTKNGLLFQHFNEEDRDFVVRLPEGDNNALLRGRIMTSLAVGAMDDEKGKEQ